MKPSSSPPPPPLSYNPHNWTPTSISKLAAVVTVDGRAVPAAHEAIRVRITVQSDV